MTDDTGDRAGGGQNWADFAEDVHESVQTAFAPVQESLQRMEAFVSLNFQS